jgi:hypothetical protein
MLQRRFDGHWGLQTWTSCRWQPKNWWMRWNLGNLGPRWSSRLQLARCWDRMFPMISCERGNLASKFNAKVLWPQVDSVALQFFVGRFGTDNCCFPWKKSKTHKTKISLNHL